MLVHNSSHITVIEIAFRVGLSKPASLFLSCRRCHFNGWLLDFAGSVWCTYDSKPTLACVYARLHPKWLAACTDSWFCLLIIWVLLYCCLSQHYSFPIQHFLQYENLGHIMCLHVWLLLTQTLFPCLKQPLIPVYWLLLIVPHVGSLAATAQFAGLFLDLLKMEFTERRKLSLPVCARLLGKVKIIVSFPAVNTVVATSNNLLGSLTFKTLGNFLPLYISSPW